MEVAIDLHLNASAQMLSNMDVAPQEVLVNLFFWLGGHMASWLEHHFLEAVFFVIWHVVPDENREKG